MDTDRLLTERQSDSACRGRLVAHPGPERVAAARVPYIVRAVVGGLTAGTLRAKVRNELEAAGCANSLLFFLRDR
jgi:hypothetical protein